MRVNLVVWSALLPVVVLIGVGLALGRTGWIRPPVVRLLSGLAFTLLTPVLLFRTMSRVHVEQLDPKPALAYILALAIAFGAMLLLRGVNRTSAVLALAVTYSNAVMIGIPLVGLAWGDAGLVTLFTLIPIHSLLLLTSATVVLEFSVAHERRAGPPQASSHRSAQHAGCPMSAAMAPDVRGRLLRVAGRALGRALLHPVPLPIIAGLLFAQTGLEIPPWSDQVMRWLGSAFGPLALVLVGIALAGSTVGRHLRQALLLAGVKNLLLPALAAVLGWSIGMSGLSLAVMVVTAALPIGANVFMFSQRYAVAQELVTASVAVSTALAIVSVSVVMLLVGAA